MVNLLGGFFKKIEKPQDAHPPSALNEFSQCDTKVHGVESIMMMFMWPMIPSLS